MYLHSIGKSSEKYGWKVMNDEMYENVLENSEDFIKEIIRNKETALLDLFRWYRNYQEANYMPKSRILSFIF